MDNAGDALDILEEKLTQAIIKMQNIEIENIELKSLLSKKAEQEKYYNEIQKENIELKNLLSKKTEQEKYYNEIQKENARLKNLLSEKTEKENNYKNIKNENIILKTRLKEFKENEILLEIGLDKLKKENNDLKKIRDSVKKRIINLISRIETGENIYKSLKTHSPDNKINLSNENKNEENLNVNEAISFYSEDSSLNKNFYEDNSITHTTKKNTNSEENDITFYTEEDKDIEKNNNQQNLF